MLLVGILTFIIMIDITSENFKIRYFFNFRPFSFYEQLKSHAMIKNFLTSGYCNGLYLYFINKSIGQCGVEGVSFDRVTFNIKNSVITCYLNIQNLKRLYSTSS